MKVLGVKVSFGFDWLNVGVFELSWISLWGWKGEFVRLMALRVRFL